VQQIQIALAPMSGCKSQPGNQAEQHRENDERNPVHILHDIPPWFRLILFGSGRGEVPIG
jgi:hypothetical protein